jgi:hypothetical protein
MPSLTADISWMKSHLISLLVCAILIYAGIYGVESIIAKHDKQTAAIYQQQNQQFQQTVQQEIAQLVAQNQQLAAQLAANQKKEQSIPVTVKDETADQVAFDISKAANSKPNAVTVQNNNVVLDLPTAQLALADMQLVPLLQQDKADLSQQLLNETKMYNDEVAAHKSDNETNQKQITALKADCRKSKLKWFGIGYVAGFISGVAIAVHGV